jgi:hypothetical protein
MACRGTGQVISNLGGAASKLTCPWCEGQGVRLPAVDAQSRWAAQDADAAPVATSQAPEPAA